AVSAAAPPTPQGLFATGPSPRRKKILILLVDQSPCFLKSMDECRIEASLPQDDLHHLMLDMFGMRHVKEHLVVRARLAAILGNGFLALRLQEVGHFSRERYGPIQLAPRPLPKPSP